MSALEECVHPSKAWHRGETGFHPLGSLGPRMVLEHLPHHCLLSASFPSVLGISQFICLPTSRLLHVHPGSEGGGQDPEVRDR